MDQESEGDGVDGIEDSATAAAFHAIDARDEVGMLEALTHCANFGDVLQYAIDRNFGDAKVLVTSQLLRQNANSVIIAFNNSFNSNAFRRSDEYRDFVIAALDGSTS